MELIPLFTGLVEEIGQVISVERVETAARLCIGGKVVCSDVEIGASISVNGCCLTVVAIDGTKLTFDVGSETLLRTNLGSLSKGAHVNLERALAVGDRMGGHYVTGHIDGLGKIAAIDPEGEWSHITVAAATALCCQMASKGSIAMDGVSLTLVNVTDESFSVMLVPHTLAVTTLGERKVGEFVNLETDVLAKYVERQLQGYRR